MERAQSGEVELEYLTVGTGEPVIFIHGAFIADTFQPLLAEPSLVGNYRLILYHRRGFVGSSRVSGKMTVSQQAEDCRGLLGHLGVERVHVVGHSYGGVVALQLALGYPAIVHSLALLEPALMLGASAQGYRDSLTRSVERARDAGAAVAVDEFLQLRCPDYQSFLDKAIPGAFAQAVTDAWTSLECELPGLIEWCFDEVDARRISQPTLSVLGGDSEALWPRFGESHRLLLEWLPNAKGFVLPGTTHFLQIQQPRALAVALAEFWQGHSLPAGLA